MRKRINRIIAVVVSVMLVLSLCACGSSDVAEETAMGEEITAEVEDEKKVEDTVTEETEAIDSVQDEEWTKEKCIEYINSCQMVEYKDLSRYPGRYINTPVRVDLCVNQDLENGAYRGYDRDFAMTPGADPMQPSVYCNNEYVFFDSRLFDSARILPEDIVTIYGDYTGPVTFTRAINNVEVEVPGIKAYFIDFWDDSVTDYVDELAAQENPNEYEYEYEYDTEPVLQYDSDLEEQQRIDEEWEWRSAKMELQKYVIYDSDVRNLTYDDIKYLSKDDIRLAKNEIYARHGYIFKSDDLKEYFNQRWWYTPQYTSDTFDESVFNEYEKHNIAFLDEAYNNM